MHCEVKRSFRRTYIHNAQLSISLSELCTLRTAVGFKVEGGEREREREGERRQSLVGCHLTVAPWPLNGWDFLYFSCSDQLLFLLRTFPYFLSFFLGTILALILLIPSCSISALTSSSLTVSPGLLLDWKASKLSRTLPRLVSPAPVSAARSEMWVRVESAQWETLGGHTDINS